MSQMNFETLENIYLGHVAEQAVTGAKKAVQMELQILDLRRQVDMLYEEKERLNRQLVEATSTSDDVPGEVVDTPEPPE